jgi:bacterioferritin (cytochrome b1)
MTEDMLKENLEAERLHLSLYEGQLHLVADNTPMRIFIEQILSEESEHVEELEMYIRHVAKF